MTGPDRYIGHGTMKKSPVGIWMRHEDHTAALSAEYARGLRDAAALAQQHAETMEQLRDLDHERHDAQAAITHRYTGRHLSALADDFIAMIPLSPSPVDASPRADTGNKEPTNDR